MAACATSSGFVGVWPAAADTPASLAQNPREALRMPGAEAVDTRAQTGSDAEGLSATRTQAMPGVLQTRAPFGVPAAARAALQDVTLVVAPVPPRPFEVAALSASTFRADEVRLSGRIGAAPDAAAARLDLATFYLAHALAPEGRSALARLDPGSLDPALRVRRDALAQALAILDGEGGGPAADHRASPFSPDAPDWADKGLFRALAAARADAPLPEARALDSAIARLPAYPRPFVEDVALDLLEVAVRAEHQAAMATLSDVVDGIPRLSETPRFSLLAGLAAQRRGQTSDAIALWEQAATGTDRAAQRARLLLADKGLQRGTKTALAASVALLEEARNDWRGGDVERDLLARLARGYEGLDDRPQAAATMAALMTRFPDSAEAARARTRIGPILDALYEGAHAGDVPIAEVLAMHRRNAVAFRAVPDFARYVETLADTLRNAGMTDAAAAEYAHACDLLDAQAVRDPHKLAALDLAGAEALVAGGQYLRALDRARGVDAAGDPQLADRRAALVAEAALGAGETALAKVTSMAEPHPDHLRTRAAAARHENDWEVVLAQYTTLVDAHRAAVLPADAIYMLTSAARLDRAAEAERAAGLIAETGPAPRAELARALSEPPEDIQPLRSRAARARIDAGEATLRALRRTVTPADRDGES